MIKVSQCLAILAQKIQLTCQFDVISDNFAINSDTIDGPDASAQVPVDNGSEFEIPQSDVVQAIANLLDFDVPFKCNPASAEPSVNLNEITVTNQQNLLEIKQYY
jgi:hypothetical protein